MNNLEVRSQLYAWLGDRTSKVDGDTHDHASLLAVSTDLAGLVERLAAQRAADELRDLRQRLGALADDLDEQFTATRKRRERDGSAADASALGLSMGYRRASLRLRDVLAGYEGSLYYGALPWMREAHDEPTCQAPYTEGSYTWLCLLGTGHDGQHEDSVGHRW